MDPILNALIWTLCLIAILVLLVFLAAIIFFTVSFYRFYKEEKEKIRNRTHLRGV